MAGVGHPVHAMQDIDLGDGKAFAVQPLLPRAHSTPSKLTRYSHLSLVWGGAHTTQCVWGSEDNLQETVLSVFHAGSKDQFQTGHWA